MSWKSVVGAVVVGGLCGVVARITGNPLAPAAGAGVVLLLLLAAILIASVRMRREDVHASRGGDNAYDVRDPKRITIKIDGEYIVIDFDGKVVRLTADTAPARCLVLLRMRRECSRVALGMFPPRSQEPWSDEADEFFSGVVDGEDNLLES